MTSDFPNLHIVKHPLIQQKLTYMRDKNTAPREFRKLLSEITALMIFEITSDLPVREITIETPMETARGTVLSEYVVLIPVLRAGLGMLDGALDLIPTAKVAHIGLYRDEKTLQPVEYYSKFPAVITSSTAIMLDPMLATGGSSSAAIALIKKQKPKHIKCVALVAAPEGVARMYADHPDVPIYTAALDRQLNELGYIVPGLGDAGDRLFGTK